jgi:DNA invertase Pin-like site-specific DNA recombinase
MYCRKSTDESNKQIQSLETQYRILKEFIKENKLNCPYVFQESKSAMNENERPEFNKMIEMISTGVANSILTVHIDRLSRNRVEMGRIIQLFQKGKLKALRTPYRSYETNQDIFSLDWELIYSAQYSDRLSIRVKEGNQTKLIKGEFPGYAKIGYINQNHKIIPDLKMAPYIKYAFETYATGKVSLKTLCETLFDMGLRSQMGNKVHVSGIDRMLSSVFYLGKFLYNGKVYDGSHEGLISEDLYNKVQDIKHNRNKPHETAISEKFPYRGPPEMCCLWLCYNCVSSKRP